MDADGPWARREADRHLEVIRAMLEAAARQAGAVDPEQTGHQLQVVLMGAMVSASSGDRAAAHRARALTELLLENAR